MQKTRWSLLWLSALATMLLAGGTVCGGEPANGAKERNSNGLSGLMSRLGEATLPGLSVLVRPDKMGVLTDNQCGINGNQTSLLSGNQAHVSGQVNALSGNRVDVLPGMRSLLGITINVQVTVHDAEKTAPKAKGNSGKKKHRAAKQQASNAK